MIIFHQFTFNYDFEKMNKNTQEAKITKINISFCCHGNNKKSMHLLYTLIGN